MAFVFIPLASWAVVAPTPSWLSHESTKPKPPLPGRQRGFVSVFRSLEKHFGWDLCSGKTPFYQRVGRTDSASSGNFCFQGKCVSPNGKSNAIFYRGTGVFMRTGFYSNIACILLEQSVSRMTQKEARKDGEEQGEGRWRAIVRQGRQRRFRAIFPAELVSFYSPIALGQESVPHVLISRRVFIRIWVRILLKPACES